MGVDKYQCLDRGEEENLRRYGQTDAPEIKINSISDIPIALLVGKYDRLCSLKDT